jgi:DinB superfamily
MQKITSVQLLNRLIQQAELHLETAIHDWQVIPHSHFARQPSPQAWSANQCLQHLNQYGRYYLSTITKIMDLSPADPRASGKTFSSGWLGGYFIKMMETQANGHPARKMKAMKGYDAYSIVPSHEVIAEFIDQQETLIALLERAKKYNLETIRIPITLSAFVRLKLGDTFQFLVAHNHRHIQQATRALELAGKTKHTHV